MKILVAPSILACDFSRLAQELKKIEAAGANLIHIDVMDGHFVPNITLGPNQVAAIKKSTKLPLDVHLMIEKPFKLLDSFVDAGADIISVHAESVSLNNLKPKVKALNKKGVRLGLAINPSTNLGKILPAVNFLDFILLMSVNPGFCGQKFMPIVYKKIERLRKYFKFDIEVDGGVNSGNARRLISCGVNILVAGNFIFKSNNYASAIRSLKYASE